MSRQLIKQPNGLYALFSSQTDGIPYYDMTAEEYLELRTREAIRDARRDATLALKTAEEYGSSAYKPFNETWESAYKKHLDMGYDPIELKETKDMIYLESLIPDKELKNDASDDTPS